MNVWIIVSTCAAGSLIGFVSGATNDSAAGHVTTGVTAFLAGLLAAAANSGNPIIGSATAKLFCFYLAFVFLTYVIGNLMRRYHWTDCVLGKPV